MDRTGRIALHHHVLCTCTSEFLAKSEPCGTITRLAALCLGNVELCMEPLYPEAGRLMEIEARRLG